jgi:hypothetical protein
MCADEISSSSFSIRRHPHLFEVNTRAWLERLSEKAKRTIRLADVPDSEWDRMAERGFDIVWLMGVWKRSAASRQVALADPANFPQYDRALPGWKPEDVVGSPYAVARYAVDARIGTWESMDRVREKLHGRRMALFLDFVGNHTALDHPWTREHPEYYVQGTEDDFKKEAASYCCVEGANGQNILALGRDPYFPAWKDVAQLNHFQAAMRAAQIETLRTIAKHCDGVRCDMAMLQLNKIFSWIWGPRLNGAAAPAREFWDEARAAVPELVLLAEAYWGTEGRLLDLGFSFAYDKELYDAVRDAKIDQVRARLEGDRARQDRAARFLENHDEARRPVVFGNERLQAVGTLMGTLPGMRFYHQGELEGKRLHLPITLRLSAEEKGDPVSAAFFEKILRITKEEVFHEGEWGLLPVVDEGDATAGNLVVYQWRTPQAWKLIAVNLAGCSSQGRVRLAGCADAGKNYIFYDELNEVRYPRSGTELASAGLFVRRDAYGAHLFDVTVAA